MTIYTFKKLKDGDTSVYANNVWQCFITELMLRNGETCTLIAAKRIFKA